MKAVIYARYSSDSQREESIEVTNIEIGGGYLTATVAEPLVNNEYTVNWSIISSDGHPLEGTFSFTVNAPVVAETNEGEAEEQSSSTEENDVANETVDEDTSEEQSNSFIFVVLAIAALVFVVGFVFVLKRKK